MANGVCDSFCDGCAFSMKTNGASGERICEYFLTTGNRRPCPAGTGCTVKETGKKLNKWGYENNVNWAKAIEERNKQRMQYARQCQMEKRAHNPLIKTCPECGGTFHANVAHQIYCSNRCKSRVESRKRYWRIKDAKAKSNDS